MAADLFRWLADMLTGAGTMVGAAHRTSPSSNLAHVRKCGFGEFERCEWPNRLPESWHTCFHGARMLGPAASWITTTDLRNHDPLRLHTAGCRLHLACFL